MDLCYKSGYCRMEKLTLSSGTDNSGLDIYSGVAHPFPLPLLTKIKNRMVGFLILHKIIENKLNIGNISLGENVPLELGTFSLDTHFWEYSKN